MRQQNGKKEERWGRRLLPSDTLEKFARLEDDVDTHGQYCLCFFDGYDDEGEPRLAEEGARESLERGEAGRYAIVRKEDSKIVHDCVVNDRGERVKRGFGASRSIDATASIGRQAVFLSEAWGQLSVDQKQDIRDLKKENRELRAQNDALKDELREALAGDSEFSELIEVGREFMQAWQGKNVRDVFSKAANKVLPDIVELVGVENAAAIARLFASALQEQEAGIEVRE